MGLSPRGLPNARMRTSCRWREPLSDQARIPRCNHTVAAVRNGHIARLEPTTRLVNVAVKSAHLVNVAVDWRAAWRRHTLQAVHETAGISGRQRLCRGGTASSGNSCSKLGANCVRWCLLPPFSVLTRRRRTKARPELVRPSQDLKLLPPGRRADILCAWRHLLPACALVAQIGVRPCVCCKGRCTLKLNLGHFIGLTLCVLSLHLY